MTEKKWQRYNKNLVKRGEIWVSRDVLQKIKEKDEEENKRGRPYKYKSIFIKFMLCPIILKILLFLYFAHPKTKPSAYKYPFFGIGGWSPPLKSP